MKNFAVCLTSMAFAEDVTERKRFFVKSPYGFGRPVINVLLDIIVSKHILNRAITSLAT